VALGTTRAAGRRSVPGRRVALRLMDNLLANSDRPALHLAGKLCDPHVGIASIPDR